MVGRPALTLEVQRAPCFGWLFSRNNVLCAMELFSWGNASLVKHNDTPEHAHATHFETS